MKIYHNPRCRKSRETLQIIQGKGITPDVIEYLKEPPGEDELKDIIKKLGIKAEELVRKNEKIFKEHFKGKEMSDSDYLDAMIQYPKLIERPIVVEGKKAVIGRPPENVIQLL